MVCRSRSGGAEGLPDPRHNFARVVSIVGMGESTFKAATIRVHEPKDTASF
jgi:hypothetical protein